MSGIRLYICIRRKDDIEIRISTTIEKLISEWDDIRREFDVQSLLLHVGTDRPSSDVIRSLTNRFNGTLITAGAFWQFPRDLLGEVRIVDRVPINGAQSEQPVLLVRGEDQDPMSAPDSESESVGIRYQYSATSEFETALERWSAQEILQYLDQGPEWLLGMPIERLHLPSRCRTVLEGKRITVVEDLARLGIDSMLKWRNFGRGSLTELGNSILNEISRRRTLESELTGLPQSTTNRSTDFERIAEGEHRDDPFRLLAVAPDWLLWAPMDRLDLTVRCHNVFRKKRIKLVCDLLPLSMSDLLDFPNFGRRSVSDLAATFRDAYFAQGDELRARFNRDLAAGLVEPSDLVPKDLPSVQEPRSSEVKASTLYQETERGLSERDLRILRYRVGLEGKSMTLEAIASKVGLTRERVRQILKRAGTRLNRLVGVALEERIEQLRANRADPIYLDLVGVEDAWFQLDRGSPRALGRLLEIASGGMYWSFELDGRIVVSKCKKAELIEAVAEARSYLRAVLSSNPNEDDARTAIDAAAAARNASEFGDYLYEQLRPELLYSSRGDSRDLVEVGGDTRTVVRFVLKEASRPLHFTAIHERVAEIIPVKRAVESIHRYAAEEGILLGYGVYGTDTHIRISQPIRDQIVREVEALMYEGPPGRQWHTNEMLGYLSREVVEAGDLDHWVLDYLLLSSNKLRSLNRLTWVRSDSEEGERLAIKDLCILALRDAGKPLSLEELEREVSSERGLNSNFLLMSHKPLGQVTPGVWGLIPRDFRVTNERIDEILDQLEIEIRSRGPLNEDGLVKLLTGCGLTLHSDLTDFMVGSLAAADERFARSRERVISLVEN